MALIEHLASCGISPYPSLMRTRVLCQRDIELFTDLVSGAPSILLLMSRRLLR